LVGGGEAHPCLRQLAVGAVEEVGEFRQGVTGFQLADQDPVHQGFILSGRACHASARPVCGTAVTSARTQSDTAEA
jgi:hypothetical protein